MFLCRDHGVLLGSSTSNTFSTHFKCFDCSICIDLWDGKHVPPCCFCLGTVSPGQLNKVPHTQGRWSKSLKQKIVWRCHRNIVHRYCKIEIAFRDEVYDAVYYQTVHKVTYKEQHDNSDSVISSFHEWVCSLLMVMHFYRRGVKCLYISWYLSSDVNS